MQLYNGVSHLLPIQTILVPQGPEYKAVCRGLSRVSAAKPLVMPIPVGSKPLTRYLQKLQADGHCLNYPQPKVLVMGLCGSLNPRYALGEIVLYQNCVYQVNATTPLIQPCDSTLTALLYSHLQEKVSLVKSLTSDRVIWSAAEKRYLSEQYGADVVDMEGFAVLEFLSQAGVAIAMLRVISDDCQHDIPDLNSSVSPDGALQPLSLATQMLRQPIAATRLIRGSLKGLKVLQEITTTLFSQG